VVAGDGARVTRGDAVLVLLVFLVGHVVAPER
jgi:hypothetical protein